MCNDESHTVYSGMKFIQYTVDRGYLLGRTRPAQLYVHIVHTLFIELSI